MVCMIFFFVSGHERIESMLESDYICIINNCILYNIKGNICEKIRIWGIFYFLLEETTALKTSADSAFF